MFPLSDHVTLQLRAEALNALNQPNFANPNGDISSATFGFVTATTGTGERNVRFGARLSFQRGSASEPGSAGASAPAETCGSASPCCLL